MDATIVFEKIFKAINAKNELGERLYKYIILEGSSRSSKTFSILQNFYLYSFSNSNKRLSVWRDTKKDCVDTVLFDMLKAFRTFPNYSSVTFNKTTSIFRYPTLSQIEIQGTDDEEKVMGYQGDVLWLNEPYKISRDTFDQLDQRTADFVLIDWNPKKDHWIDDLKKDSRAIVIHSTFLDNPFCPEEQRLKILSYQPVSMCSIIIDKLITEPEAFAYNIIDNKLNFTSKQLKELHRCRENENKNSASAYKWSVYGLGLKAEKPNRIFKWQEIQDNEYLEIEAPIYYGVDWGKVDSFGIVEAKYYDGELYLKEINYDSENNIRAKLTPYEIEEINSIDEGLIVWLFNKNGINYDSVIVCDSNRPLKIKALRDAGYDYSISAVKGPGSIVDGIDLLSGLTIKYTSSSKNIKYEQENYSYKTDRYGVVIDEPEDINNHLIDPTRYIAQFLKKEGIIRNV